MKLWSALLTFSVFLPAVNHTADAQQPVPMPAAVSPSDPTTPAARHVRDAREHLSFNLPAGWNLSRHDGELSTFALDARSAPAQTQLHAVANLNFNPFPYSTFSGAIFYVASTPRSTAKECAAEASAPVSGKGAKEVTIDGVVFRHGYNEIGRMCIEGRDEVYTAIRGSSCLRFDLVINTFCGSSSGARDMTAGELASVERRLEDILYSVRFDKTSAARGSVSAARTGATR